MLIETGQYAPGLVGSATPWTSAADHKERMENFRFGATFISLTRDHGHGSVAADANGEAVPMYSVNDERDVENLRKGIDVQARLHEAAGAHTIVALAAERADVAPRRRLRGIRGRRAADPVPRGRPQALQRPPDGHVPDGPRSRRASVADPRGELHDTQGVWIGDASAFPTSSGTNPMITIMALARRTARRDRRRCRRSRAEAGAASDPEEVTVGN